MRKGWEYKKLGEVCCPKSKIQRATKCFGGSDEILYIDISSIDNSVQEVNSITSFTMSNAPSRAQQKVEYGDIIVSTVRPNLKNVAFIKQHDSNLVVSSGFCVLRTTDDIERNYLFRYIASDIFTQHLMKLTTGANYPAVRDLDVRDSTIPLPPKSTQIEIVSELDKINELIRLKKEQLKDFDNLAQSLFYEMFGDPVENEMGWEVKTFGEIGSVERGAGISKKDFVKEGLPCIHYGQLHTILGPRTTKHFTSIPHNLLPKYKIAHTGDLVMAITSEDVEGSCKSTVWLGDYDIIVGSDAAIFHHKQDGTFLSFYTMTKAFFNEKAKYAKGFKVTHISAKEIEKIPVYLPPLSLQRLFAQRIEQIEREKSEVQKSIQDLETLLASRMQYWFE